MAEDLAAAAARAQDLLLHALFDSARKGSSPAFVLLTGAAGAGSGRAIARLRAEYGTELVPISTEDLEAFHPRYLDARFRMSPIGQRELSQFAASGLQASISHARQNGYSLLLEGTFRNPDTALGVARRFADSGYDVRVVVVSARDDQSLLTVTSHGLRRVREGRSAEFTTPAENEHSIGDVNALIVAAADSPVVDRVSILDQRGVSVFYAERTSSGMLPGAFAALSAAQAEPMTALEAAQWLSELRHMTEYARSLRSLPTTALDSLIELHKMAIRQVLPDLPVPAGSEVVRIQHAKLADDLTALERMRARPETVDAAAPTVAPTQPGPSISR
ncbi:zeta toxin family protein [Microbacterium esteraromaticum]|uniref:zeta toxin family protein n=1 Tax=Microbacterium esteraromaticum TaxID=57043 RepID=UPI001A8EEB38|nr:zeta toxin family protein [Microbacterium esteraromaticum]MBN8424414.1 zeta toxin family protein [Microbacterium esteraromaticum]